MTEPRVRFVILAVARTGSNMLCTLLDSHPEVVCHHELFNPNGVYYALDLRNGSFDLGTIEERDRDPLGFLNRAWAAGLGCTHVGFKMTQRQNSVVLDAVLHDHGVRKIVLRRHNRIRTYVSRLIAETTGQWEVYHEVDLARKRPRVRVELADLRRSIAEDEAYYAHVEGVLETSGQAWLGVSYEHLLCDTEQARLLAFLDLPVLPDANRLRVRSIRQNPQDLADLIINFAELETQLRYTTLEGDLGDTRRRVATADPNWTH